MQTVEIDAIPLGRLADLLAPDRAAQVAEYADRARASLAGRTVWNVNATATGGGVAEMLQSLLAYVRGAGVDTRWMVLDAVPEFFTLTKRIHNLLHGSPGDALGLGPDDRALYESVLTDNLAALTTMVRPGDLVLLHDPQTAGLAEGLRAHGAHVIWRCHIGLDTTTAETDLAWEFLRPYVEQAQALIFTRPSYVPAWADAESVRIIAPSLDPFSAKNTMLDDQEVAATLRQAGLVDLPSGSGNLDFVRRDGTSGVVRPHRGLIAGDQIVPADARLVLQVSRWDRLKDMGGVLSGFVDHLEDLPPDVHLMLVGPDTSGVTDDPEGAEVFAECLELWQRQTPEARRRLHICSLPMDDVDENAHLVNALQRHASVVVQKSLVEGFGLTATEPMWKARPVLASRVGGIQDQIIDGQSGLLLDDPADLDEFASALVRILTDDALASRLGPAARERVREHFLGDRHLIQYVELFEDVIGG